LFANADFTAAGEPELHAGNILSAAGIRCHGNDWRSAFSSWLVRLARGGGED
jgi:hypothetical protein